MRWHTRHLSGHVPGPTSMMNVGGAIATVVAVLLLGVLTVIKFLMIALGFVLKALPKVLGWLVVGITAPLWWPIRGLHRHHQRKLDRKAMARVRRMQVAPTGPRIG